MTLIGFYKGVENKIKLHFGAQHFEAEGVANFGRYEKKTPVNFQGTSAEIQNPDVHNLFNCKGEKKIYLDNHRTGFDEIRFTTQKGWLRRDGTPVLPINQDLSGKDIIPGVYCFTVCQEATVSLSSGGPTKDAAKMEYKCSGGLVKVASNFYASVSCDNDQWKGDGNNFDVSPPQYTFAPECYGAFKFVKDCVTAEKDNGCGKVKSDGVGVSCEDGFLLTLVGHDVNKVRKSLQVNKDDHWFDGTEDIGKTAANDRPQCYSKCAPTNIIHEVDAATGAVDAKYDYKADVQVGTLSCSDSTDVLVVTLDGTKSPYVKDVLCDKDGWKIQGKPEKVAEHQSGKVHAECHKACDVNYKEIDCPTTWTKPDDCGQIIYSSKTLKCSTVTEVLFVNGNPIDKPLVCTKAGWAKEGDPTNMIIDHLKKYKDPVNAKCFSRCGKKFVSGDATPTKITTGIELSCDESKMIGYKLNDAQVEIDTLEKLVCDSSLGWKDGLSTQFVTFATGQAAKIEANCKTSCSQQLITKKCEDRSPGCAEAILTGEELKCDDGKWLYAQDKVETGTIQCKTKSFESKAPSTTIKIDRTSPTSTAEISCLSKCDKTLMVTAGATDAAAKKVEEAGKLTETEAEGKFDVACTDELHYTAITRNNDAPTTKYSQKWTCNPNAGWSSAEDPQTPFADWINGENIKKTCRNKCKGRFMPCEPPISFEPLDDDNKLKCKNTHVLRVNENSQVLDFEREELVCKKDGFYSKDALVLKFDDKPAVDAAKKFDVKCFSKCDVKFVSDLDQPMKDKLKEIKLSDPEQLTPVTDTGKKNLQCNANEMLFLHSAENPATGRRVFVATECNEAVGWTGKVAAKDANGVWTASTEDTTIVDFATQSAKIVASCMKVCDALMLSDKCENEIDRTCKPMKHAGTKLSCLDDDNHRLFLNEKKSQDSRQTKTLQCTKEGWTDGNEFVIDFRETPDEIPTIVNVYCKHKCHKDFIEFTHGSCPDVKICSEAKYEGGKLSCAGATEILVIEHDGKRRESFKASNPLSSATCDNEGWKDESSAVLFALTGMNFHIKARCEDICTAVPHVDQADDQPPTSRSFDAAASVLTCTKETEMLALERTGVYADMICSKAGWSTVKWSIAADGTPKAEALELKIKFEPMIDDTVGTKQDSERAKNFTCVKNDCLRSFNCKGHDYSKTDTQEDCINPNITKIKYEMSCTSPSKLKKIEDNEDHGIAYDSLTCFDGEWKEKKSDPPIVSKLKTDEILKLVPDRSSFDVICSTDACTGCTNTDLANISSTTDANFKQIQFNVGTFRTCSNFKCGTGAHYVIEQDTKSKYYLNDGVNTIKCSSIKGATGSKTFSAPDLKSSVVGKVGCVIQIPCNEHRPLNTDCTGRPGCDAEKFNQLLKDGSRLHNNGAPQPVKCNDLGQMYYEKETNKWSNVTMLQCTEKGEWSITTVDKTLPEDIAGASPHIICSKLDPNPEAVVPENDKKTATCTYCPFPPVLGCEGCKKPEDHATATNDGNWKCTMKIVNGRFKFNGGEEIEKGADLVCQDVNGEYNWITPDGKKIDTLAVIMKETDNISTGTIAGIVIGVVLVLGLIIFAMVYMTIRKRKEAERQEKLKSKGLEQKQDSIIDGATIVDDTKTLVL